MVQQPIVPGRRAARRRITRVIPAILLAGAALICAPVVILPQLWYLPVAPVLLLALPAYRFARMGVTVTADAVTIASVLRTTRVPLAEVSAFGVHASGLCCVLQLNDGRSLLLLPLSDATAIRRIGVGEARTAATCLELNRVLAAVRGTAPAAPRLERPNLPAAVRTYRVVNAMSVVVAWLGVAVLRGFGLEHAGLMTVIAVVATLSTAYSQLRIERRARDWATPQP